MSLADWVVWAILAALVIAAMASGFDQKSDAWTIVPPAIASVIAFGLLLETARRQGRSLAQVAKALGGAVLGTVVVGVIAWVPLFLVAYFSHPADRCLWDQISCEKASGLVAAELAWIVAMAGAPRCLNRLFEGSRIARAAVRTSRWWVLLGSCAVGWTAYAGDGVPLVATVLAIPGLWLLLAAGFLSRWESRAHREPQRRRGQRRLAGP